MTRSLSLLLPLLAAAAAPLGAQTPRLSAPRTAPMLAGIDASSAHYADVALRIWEFAELFTS
jgi:hypothetical protein